MAKPSTLALQIDVMTEQLETLFNKAGEVQSTKACLWHCLQFTSVAHIVLSTPLHLFTNTLEYLILLMFLQGLPALFTRRSAIWQQKRSFVMGAEMSNTKYLCVVFGRDKNTAISSRLITGPLITSRAFLTHVSTPWGSRDVAASEFLTEKSIQCLR